MAKGKRDPNWKQKVLEWEASDKSGVAWSKENNIPYTTLLGWKHRLKNAKKRKPSINPHAGFVELKDKISSHSGVYLEYQSIRICLEADFNPIVLKQALDCLAGVQC